MYRSDTWREETHWLTLKQLFSKNSNLYRIFACCFCFLPLIPLYLRVVLIIVLDAVFTVLKLVYWLYFNYYFIQEEHWIDLVLFLDVIRALSGAAYAREICRFITGSTLSARTGNPFKSGLFYTTQIIGIRLWDVASYFTAFNKNFCIVAINTPLMHNLAKLILHPLRVHIGEDYSTEALPPKHCSTLMNFAAIFFTILFAWTAYFSFSLIAFMWENRLVSNIPRRFSATGTRSRDRLEMAQMDGLNDKTSDKVY